MEGEAMDRPMTSRGSVEVERAAEEEDKNVPQTSAKGQPDEGAFEETEGSSKAESDEVGCSANSLNVLKRDGNGESSSHPPTKRRKVLATPWEVRSVSVKPTLDELEMEWQSAALYSRACSICSTDHPRQRCFFSQCGHTICRACAVKLTMDAGPRDPACPFCRKESKTVRLHEDDPDCYDEPSPGGGDEQVREAQALRRILDKDDVDCKREKLGGCSTSICTSTTHLCFSRQSWVASRRELVESYLREEISETAYTRRYNGKLESEVKYREGRGGTREDVFDEEYDRLNYELPQGASRCRLADCAADAGRRRERKRLIGILKVENEENAFSGRRYSRACSHCKDAAPKQRCVFSICGHVVCRSCADKLIGDNQMDLATCPTPNCHIACTLVNLFEDLI